MMDHEKRWKSIPLSNGMTTKVDLRDYDDLSQYRWYSNKNPYPTRVLYDPISKKRTAIPMHRQIMNPAPGLEVDHINGDIFDNRRSNLRICSHSDNCKNRGRSKNNKSSTFKGVYKSGNKFISQIQVNKTLIYLGTFNTATEAAIAYDKAAMRGHGDFANLNIIREGKMPRLENWSLVGTRLIGNVFSHPLFSDGDQITTSTVKSFDATAGVATTQNSIYTLGAAKDATQDNAVLIKEEDHARADTESEHTG